MFPFFKFHLKEGINASLLIARKEGSWFAFGEDQCTTRYFHRLMRCVTSDTFNLNYSLTMAKTSLSLSLSYACINPRTITY